MSHKYVCDRCGEDLNRFYGDNIMHITYDSDTLDFCPWCSKKIKDDVDCLIDAFRRDVSTSSLLTKHMLEEKEETNRKYLRYGH